MMARAKKMSEPGHFHRYLERFMGTWSYEFQLFSGGVPSVPDKGTTEVSWLIPNRWIQSKDKGELMGQAYEGVMVMGYDNFKQSFVTTYVSNVDTTMQSTRGRLAPEGNSLVTYGVVDDVMTGKQDKMMKYIWRFESAVKRSLEIHDLSLPDGTTKVVEIRYSKQVAGGGK